MLRFIELSFIWDKIVVIYAGDSDGNIFLVVFMLLFNSEQLD